MASETIRVEVAYALPEDQRIIPVDVEPGTVAYDAAVKSKITDIFPDIDLENAKMGLFGKAVKPKTQVLEEGDRVEIYRPLKSDPKATRKARADKARKSG